jgi:uncharacterized protein YndB with AHSA1/START domain
MTSKTAELAWELEREIVLTRVFDAPRALVFRAWTEARHLDQWFGPSGFTTQTHEFDFRVGQRWRYEMRAPNGQCYPGRIVFLEVSPPTRLVFDHGDDLDNDPGKFRVTITFDEQSDGKTVVTLRQLHPTRAQRDAGIGFGAVEMGYQTLDKLAAFLRQAL